MLEALQSILSQPNTSSTLIGAMIGVLGSISVALLTVAFNRGKFMREKIWEQRQLACNEILAELANAETWGQAIKEGFEFNPEDYFQSPHVDETNQRLAAHIDAAYAAFRANYLILPPGFRARFERMQRYQAGLYLHVTGPDIYLEPIAIYEHAKRELYDLARLELNIVPWWKRSFLRARLLGDTIGRKMRGARLRYLRYRHSKGLKQFFRYASTKPHAD
jgi:hypothetical protein